MTIEELRKMMNFIAHFEIQEIGGEFVFEDLEVPERWFRETGTRQPLMRCPNDHVSQFGLQQDEGGLVCLKCFEPVVWTFPEDREGPLVCHLLFGRTL